MAKRAKKKAAIGLPAGESKLSTNIPERLHRRLKAAAALQGVSIRDLIVEYAEKIDLDKLSKRTRH